MVDLMDKKYHPSLEEISEYIGCPMFLRFCSELKETYKCSEQIEFSSCRMERGWNIKFKKSGKSLCTIDPRESYFTVMVVVGRKEKAFVEAILEECTPQLREIYHQTKEGNGQRWLMLDLEDCEAMYQDILRLIAIRRGGSIV